MFQIGLKVKNTVLWTYVITDLKGQEIEMFYKKEKKKKKNAKKQIKKSLELKK